MPTIYFPIDPLIDLTPEEAQAIVAAVEARSGRGFADFIAALEDELTQARIVDVLARQVETPLQA
jgi:predicted DNA-binding transcriptional regulator YafY